MTKQFTALILIIVFALCPTASFAIDASLTRDVITINGGSFAAGANVPVLIVKPNITPEGISDGNIKQSIIMAYEALAAADGSLNLMVRLPQDSPAGWYTVWAGAESDDFYYATEAEIDSAVAAFKNATNDTIASAIKTYSVDKPIVYLDLTGIYADHTAYVRRVFVTELGTNAPASVADIQTSYAASLDIAKFTKGTAADVLSLLGESAYSGYVDSCNSAADVADMVIKLRPAEMYTLTEVASVMRKANALAALNGSEKSEVMAYAVTYNDVLGLNLTGDYLNCDSLEVAKVLAGQGFTSIEAVQKAFADRVTYLTSNKDEGYTPSPGGNSSPGFSASVGTGTTPSQPSAPQTPSAGHGFGDMAGYEWAEGYVTALAKKGVINGVSQGMYAPGESVTREQYLKMIALSLGAAVYSGEDGFDDTDSNAWYAPYVVWGSENGIVNGMSDTRFGIDEAITREDMCVIACRALEHFGLKLTASSLNFTDSELVSSYASDSVSALAADGIISGRPDGSFAPKDYLNRAEAAKVIYLIMQKGGAFGD